VALYDFWKKEAGFMIAKRIIPLFLTLLFLTGCADDTAADSTPHTTQPSASTASELAAKKYFFASLQRKIQKPLQRKTFGICKIEISPF